MLIEVHTVEARLARADEHEKEWLRDYLTFTTKGFAGRDGGVVRMLNVLTDRFPAGFVPLVRAAAAKDGRQVDILDLRPPGIAPTPGADVEWLRDYQREALRVALERERGILWLPTGAGKTELACGLARSVPGTWLFLVHRLSLLGQTMARFESRLGEVAGTVDGDSGTWRRFTVATFQTLARRIKTDPALRAKVASVDGIIVDEAHTLPADSFYGVTLACTNARYRIGLSGTPLARGDRRSVYTIGALGPVIHRIRPEVLIERGVLSRPKIHLADVLHDPPEAVTWQGVYAECVVRSRRRNLAVLSAIHQSPRPCLVFVSAVEHGHELVRLMGKQGITAEFVWGDDSEEQRQASIRRLVRGDIEVLVCSVIFQEGVDIPALRSVVIAAGGASGIAAIQRVGRGMRMAEGKDEFVVWDVSDRGHRWLERHTRARRKAYEAEGYEIVSQQMDLRELK